MAGETQQETRDGLLHAIRLTAPSFSASRAARAIVDARVIPGTPRVAAAP
jgi:hypothetical protein